MGGNYPEFVAESEKCSCHRVCIAFCLLEDALDNCQRRRCLWSKILGALSGQVYKTITCLMAISKLQCSLKRKPFQIAWI